MKLKEDRMIVNLKRPKYTMEELLAQRSGDQKITDGEREWLDAPAVGRELLSSEKTAPLA